MGEVPRERALCRRWYRTAVALTALYAALASCPICGVSQCCDPSLEPVENLDLQYRERGDRCEGFYQANVASGDVLQIVGLTYGIFTYNALEDQSIVLDCPLASDCSVHVRAVGVPIRMYYQMDATVGPGETLLWPLDEVVLAQGIPAEDIALSAWIGDPESISSPEVYVPVRVSGGSEYECSTCPVVLCIRSSADVGDVQWRFAAAHDGTCGTWSDWKPVSDLLYSAGRQIRISIEVQDAQRVCVEVAARTGLTAVWVMVKGILVIGASHQ
jgi:hypothetical protein